MFKKVFLSLYQDVLKNNSIVAQQIYFKIRFQRLQSQFIPKLCYTPPFSNLSTICSFTVRTKTAICETESRFLTNSNILFYVLLLLTYQVKVSSSSPLPLKLMLCNDAEVFKRKNVNPPPEMVAQNLT